MPRKTLRPVTVAGIEFDALMDEQKTMSATVPAYPVEEGFPVSDTIILEPLSVRMTLYVTNTPVTWLHRHGNSVSRVNRVCEMMESLWLDKKLVKIVTADAIYTDMGITSIAIKKSKEIGYAREISLQAQKVRVTNRKTVIIPGYILKSGETMANAGAASSSASSAKSSAGSAGSSGSSGSGGSGSSSSGNNSAKKSQSILYGAATGLGFI